ncbi:riboflavin synthase [Mesohalobacter halotolerans]|uniref:Riboflavin synthase n=1 Tax=Mesohalobacter halotolerans TaxID=1883405 RepID=A0A4U5TTH0_9FLAO|nr:riboflavin synthase [Mesohalobacter halotolerans]MBS3738987.1 riboflavin synthase [Psychroflexus sp.]TKS57677.1 riboflavin synthase [Mesohalobacter halotolerans]
MFTGIIEEIGEVINIEKDKTNVNFDIKAQIAKELKIDQSVSHNGVCLTVVSVDYSKSTYRVTAIDETLKKTNFGKLTVGSKLNLERGALINSRLDGHIVQGHVDQTAQCIQAEEIGGSWVFRFEYDSKFNNVTIEKGSITINGVSLTVVDSEINSFSVSIIPYTYHHTTFKTLEAGEIVNLEFDVIGKYVKRLFELKND